ncbi:MAG: hypothetical protein HZB66_02660 [Candidatus Aenigmarchaeota archaeon]|nr:hypothetical protein [Candidatus Aenigmarchaeota archaeon]
MTKDKMRAVLRQISAFSDPHISFWMRNAESITPELRCELEYAPREELESIVKEYESKPWYTKFLRCVFHYYYLETHLKYDYARGMLDGSFSWKKIDEAEEKRQKAREFVEKGKRVKRFDGNLLELERYTGERYEILSPRRVYNTDFEHLGELGADCLIDSEGTDSPRIDFPLYTGIPVKKIESEPDCT